MEAKEKELALRVAIIATYFGFERIKLGNEGIMMHYDICVQIAEKSLKFFPMDFDWEAHYEKNGDDFDVEIENFAKQIQKLSQSIFKPFKQF